MSKHKIRSIVVGLSVVALCVALTLPVLAAPPSGPAAPGFLTRIWHSLTGLISGPAPPPDDSGHSELRKAAGEAGRGFVPDGNSMELLDPEFSEEESTSLTAAGVPEEESTGTSDP